MKKEEEKVSFDLKVIKRTTDKENCYVKMQGMKRLLTKRILFQ